jgi:hypothetical protein
MQRLSRKPRTIEREVLRTHQNKRSGSAVVGIRVTVPPRKRKRLHCLLTTQTHSFTTTKRVGAERNARNAVNTINGHQR